MIDRPCAAGRRRNATDDRDTAWLAPGAIGHDSSSRRDLHPHAAGAAAGTVVPADATIAVSTANADRRVALPNGLRVYGATPAVARFQHFISGYFAHGFEPRPGMTVFDVGANIGLFSLEVLHRCAGDAEVFAFEPAPASFGHLERNLHELFPSAHVRLRRTALGDRVGDAILYVRPRTTVTTSLYPEPFVDPDLVDGFLRDPPPEYRGRYSSGFRRLPRAPVKTALDVLGRWLDAKVVPMPCPITTLAAVLDAQAITVVDFLKIDVEGAELDVLRGVGDTNWPKIRRLAIEVHDIDGRVGTIRTMLADRGFHHIAIEQDWPFQGTLMYTVHAC